MTIAGDICRSISTIITNPADRVPANSVVPEARAATLAQQIQSSLETIPLFMRKIRMAQELANSSSWVAITKVRPSPTNP